jgi:outer membrane protein
MYKDTLKPPPPAVKKQLEEELPQLINTIQNWQQIVNQAMEAKQNELLAPLYRKIYDAIRAVAKEKAYTHVLNKESLLVAPDADDMIAAVAAKLKLSLPKQTGPAAPMK